MDGLVYSCFSYHRVYIHRSPIDYDLWSSWSVHVERESQTSHFGVFRWDRFALSFRFVAVPMCTSLETIEVGLHTIYLFYVIAPSASGWESPTQSGLMSTYPYLLRTSPAIRFEWKNRRNQRHKDIQRRTNVYRNGSSSLTSHVSDKTHKTLVPSI